MRAGDVLSDRFEIEREAGAGGMGMVFRARDRTTGEPVAIKIIRNEGKETLARFAREATLLSTLSHPGIVRYVDHGFGPQGESYIAMEWLEGEDLEQRLARGPLRVVESVALVAAMADALATVHAAGILHRDIKPSNAFLQGGDLRRVRLLDFGVARASTALLLKTGTGAALGTPRYMAPEQARGDRAADARADVFSLGCVLFECLTGRPTFAASHIAAVLAKILFEEAPRVSELVRSVAPELDDLVASMLAKHPEDRPASARAVAEALEAMIVPSSSPAPSRAPRSGLTAHERRHATVLLVAASPIELDRTLPMRLQAWERAASAQEPPSATTALRLAVQSNPGARLEVLLDGSAVVMFSGAGQPTDDAQAAAACALALLEAAPSSLIAVASGRAQVGYGMPVGEVIDRAAQLVSLSGDDAAADSASLEQATLGSILLDQTTADLLDTRYDVRESSEGIRLTGRRERETVRTLLGKPTPCIGRDAELGLLDATLAQCIDESVARAVLITAAPGTGKSRLRYEFLRRTAARPERVQLWLARGDPMRAGATLGLAAHLLRGAAGILDGEAPAAQREKLTSRVAAHVAADEALGVAEFLGELVGTPFPDDGRPQLRAARQSAGVLRDQMLNAWETFLAAECKDGPLVLVLEDLHWSDPGSVELVDAALRRCAESPLLVVALGRPEVRQLFPNLWADKRVHEVRLGALTRKASERLVRSALPNVSNAAMARIVDQSGGNAFFLEELIRSMHEGTDATAPPTVLAMVGARIGAFEAPARQILRAASVFGDTFWAGGISALIRESADTRSTRRWLDELARREVVSSRPSSKLRGEDEYTFRHALVREAAYAMLTEQDRVRGHRLAAQWLERVGEGDALVLAESAEHTERVARALLAAGDGDGAATWFARTGLSQLKVGNLEACIQSLLLALRAVDPNRRLLEDLIAWIRALAKAVGHVRRAEGMRDIAAPVIERILSAGVSADTGVALVEYARALGAVDAFDDAHALLARLGEAKDQDPAIRQAGLVAALELYLRRGEFSRAFEFADRLPPVAELDDLSVILLIAQSRAIAGATEAALEALAVVESRLGPADLHLLAEVEKQRVIAHIRTGNYALIVEASRKAIERARAAGLRHMTAAGLHNLADALRHTGNHAEAADAFRASLEMAEAAQLDRLAMLNRMYLAHAAGLAGEPNRDRELVALIAKAESHGFWNDVTAGYALLGHLQELAGATEGARHAYGKVLDLCRQYGQKEMLTEAEQGLARLG